MTQNEMKKLCCAKSRDPYIKRLIVGMQNSLKALGVAKPPSDELEHWAITIHESMSASSRNYHSVQHVFDLANDQTDPILVLSAFWHDCIYHHVDGGFTQIQASILRNVIHQKDSSLFLSQHEDEDELLAIVECIFGFVPGQSVGPNSGLNEFLSAVVAVRQLEPVLSTPILAQIACCIEATIPFRPPKNDKTAMERLFDRMVLCNKEFHLGLSDTELVESVQRAVRLSNLDVGNFGTTDRAWFLDNAWSLLPETNESLRSQYLYSVGDFQAAIYKLYKFFPFLQPNLVFCEFRGVPAPKELERLTREATRNINIGATYVSAKLLSLSLLMAFATLTGGDAPMSLFMGDLPSRNHVSRRLETDLTMPESIPENCDPDVYQILLHGRTKETTFDIRQSPLAAYLYGWLGDDGLTKICQESQLYPIGDKEARELLSRVPTRLVRRVATNMAAVAVTRADAIQSILEGLPKDDDDALAN